MSQKKKIKIQTESKEEESKLETSGKARTAEAELDKTDQSDINDPVKDLEDKLHGKEEKPRKPMTAFCGFRLSSKTTKSALSTGNGGIQKICQPVPDKRDAFRR